MKTITIGDNGWNRRRDAHEGRPVWVERKGAPLVKGETVRLRFRDEQKIADGGPFRVDAIEPSDHMPQGEWKNYRLVRASEGGEP